jgi:hypothetical protein
MNGPFAAESRRRRATLWFDFIRPGRVVPPPGRWILVGVIRTSRTSLGGGSTQAREAEAALGGTESDAGARLLPHGSEPSLRQFGAVARMALATSGATSVPQCPSRKLGHDAPSSAVPEGRRARAARTRHPARQRSRKRDRPPHASQSRGRPVASGRRGTPDASARPLRRCPAPRMMRGRPPRTRGLSAVLYIVTMQKPHFVETTRMRLPCDRTSISR